VQVSHKVHIVGGALLHDEGVWVRTRAGSFRSDRLVDKL
jgi:hypothetical protein